MDCKILPAVTPSKFLGFIKLILKKKKTAKKKPQPWYYFFFKYLFADNSLYFQFIANEFWQLKSKTINGFEQKKTKTNEQTPQKPFFFVIHSFLLQKSLGLNASFCEYQCLVYKTKTTFIFCLPYVTFMRGSGHIWDWRALLGTRAQRCILLRIAKSACGSS